jgi:8-hydroxy-5-deazaflavin:NADPH oxidoreductase
MVVTIIGAGQMGRSIGTRFAAGGIAVEVIDSDDGDARALADELAGRGDAEATVAAGGQATGEVVVLALPYDALPAAVRQYGDDLAGKVVVEISNPVDFSTFDRLVAPPDSSAAEEVAGLVGDGTSVVKAFNTTLAKPLLDGEVAGQQLDVLIAGDDEDAKQKLAVLIEAGGLRPIDVGPLRRARELERLGFLHMSLQARLGWHFRSAVKFLS